MKKVLIISPHFPPVNAPDMQRVRMSLPYFRDLGWEPVIICVDEQYVKGYRDELLTRTYPEDIEVYKVKAYSAERTRKFGLGSISMRSFFQFRSKGNDLLKSGDFDLVYFSTTAFHVCRLGPYWKKKFKVPFIIDMQDPWRNDFYLDKPRSQRPPKFFISYNIDKYLEATTIPHANGIISVSEGYREILMNRYPSLTADKFAIIPFAVSLNDITVLKDHPVQNAKLDLPAHKFNIVYAGRGGYDLGFALQIIFAAFKKGLEKNSDLFSQVHFSFMGTSYAPEGQGGYTILPVAEKFGVGKMVTETPSRISYFETLALLDKADMLLVPGSTDTSYTASKIYPYILSGKPLMAVFHKDSSVVSVLGDLEFGECIAFDNSLPFTNYIKDCEESMECILSGRKETKPVDIKKFFKYTAAYNTVQQVEFFEQTLSKIKGSI